MVDNLDAKDYPFLKFINSMYLNDKTIVQKKIIEDGAFLLSNK